ncbi:DUF885 domain-containing protein [Caulobacter sp. NIBR2454]|uniref:DUF885 domain-containing protein n=1 Tax=Caulobacter sp. NIBR2454 TaxID=3015996 RepID=UPI0022B7055F|nr:DUF885 family protein [Caulobacter sp. NIBR2454]
MQSRRQLLQFTAAAGLFAAAPRFASAAAPASPEAAKMNVMFDAFMKEQLERFPEYSSYLGLDKGPMASLKSRISDLSPSAQREDARQNAERLARLRTIDRAKLTGMDVVNYDTVEFTLNVADEVSKASPALRGQGSVYVLSQLSGLYQQAPDFMDNMHTIENAADAEAYLSRLSALGKALDQELEVAVHDEKLGITPPDFVIDKALVQMKSLRDEPLEKTTLVESLVRRTKAKGLSPEYGVRAAKIYTDSVLPALNRQIAHMERLRKTARHDAGIGGLPNGPAIYAASLKSYTTSKLTPDEIHKLGLDLVASLSAETDKQMRSQGLTQGTVGERFRALYNDPAQHYPNTDEGKVQLIQDLNAQIKVIEAKLPAYFGQLPKAAVEVRRVPPAIEAGAPGGSYNSPPLDNSRPGIYWINLVNTAAQPRFTLPTLTYHEALPGHHLQLALSGESQGIPLIRKAIGFSGYSEGWGLYAEELAVEMGMYEKDRMGQIGMLHDALFRAVRLVVDTGLHHKGWSREQAIKYYVAQIGDEEAAATREVERYCVWPGQACSYMVGKITWMRLREKAKTALGSKFDIREFHDAGLLAGGTPLTTLENVIDNYIASAKA